MRLLAITPPVAVAPEIDVGLVDLWLDAGAATLGMAVLLREPGLGPAETLAQPRLAVLRRTLAARGVPSLLSVDSREDPGHVAALLDDVQPVAGVQLRGDPSVAQCQAWRTVLGPQAILGRSVHGTVPTNPPGLDYTCVAPIYAPQTQQPGEDKRAIGLDGLRCWTALRADVIALGGMTPRNARTCLDVGACGVAGIRLFFGPRAEAGQDVAALCRVMSGGRDDHVPT